MATGPTSAVEPGAGAPAAGATACAITRPATPIGISILDPATLAAVGLPPRLQIEDPPGELWFKAGGQAVYQPDADGPSVISFRYVADPPAGSADPATAYVLVNGAGPLPPGALNDPSLIAACSRAEALEVALAQPGAPVQPPEPGVRVEVPVDAFAGAEIALLDAAFQPAIAKYLLVDGGVVVFLEDGRVVFLAGADRVDLPGLPEYLLPDELGFPAPWDAATLLAHAKGAGEAQLAPLAARAELEASHVAFLTSPPAGALPVATLARTELPFCGAEARCEVYEYQDSAYILVSETLAAALGGAAGDLGWFVPGGQPLVVLAAAGALDALAATAPDADLAAYWLERDAGSSVIRIDGFFAQAGQPDPPDLSIGESRFVGADVLLQVAQPVMLPGFESADPVLRIPPSAFPSRLDHGGGAGFSTLDAGGLGEGLVPLLEQPPTALPQGESREITEPRPPVGGNRQPVANDDLAATFNDQPILLHPLVNDFDPDPGDVIRLLGSPALVETPASEVMAESALQGLAQSLAAGAGSAVLLDPQTIRYVPDPEFEGTATIRYVIADNRGGVSAPATITVAVVDRGPPGNLPPVAVDDAAVTPIGRPVTVDVLANDFDQDDLPNRLLPDGEGIPLTIGPIVVRPEHGTLERIGAGGAQELRYTPEAGFSGSDRFSYTVLDGLSPSQQPGVVTIQVGRPELQARDDLENLAQVGGEPLAIAVLANDSGVDLAIVELVGSPLGAPEIDGDVVLYRPPALSEVQAPGRIFDQFSYTVSDGRGSDSALVRVDLNRAPAATNDRVEIAGRALVIDVLTNDRDLDDDVLAIVGLGAPAQPGAAVEISADGRQIVYTRPLGEAPGEPFSDAFDYTIGDGRGGFASATVRLSGVEGPIAPTLTVEPAAVRVVIADDFVFPTAAPFPDLGEGQMLDPALVNGVTAGDLTFDVSRTVAVSFVSEAAGFANSLGFYRLVDGVPTAPELIFARVDEGVLATGETVQLGRFAADVELGLFLVQNAADLLEGASELAFRTDAEGRQTLVRIDGGVERAIDAPLFFTGGDLNGGAVQAVAGHAAGSALRIGFEDQAVGRGADADYNDVVLEVSYGNVTSPGLGLAVTIDDPDSAAMTRATVRLATGAPGDYLLLGGGRDELPADVTVTGEGTGELVFTGAAAALDYEQLLEAVALEVDVLDGARELVFQVSDDSSPDPLESNLANVRIVPVAAEADAAGSAGAVDGGALLASLLVAEPVAA